MTIAKAALTEGVDTIVYTLPEGIGGVLNIRFCNRNPVVSAKIRLAISSSAVAPSAEDYIEYDDWLREETGLRCNPGDVIWARANTADVTVVIHGELFEETVVEV